MPSIPKIEEAGKLEVAPPFGAQSLELSNGTCHAGADARSAGVEEEEEQEALDLFESQEDLATNMVRCLEVEPPFLALENDFNAQHRMQLCKDYYGLKVVQQTPAPWSCAAAENHMALTHWLINLVTLIFGLACCCLFLHS